MPEYLKEAPDPEAMNVAWGISPEPPILQHTIWTGDHPGLGKHNIPCQVCFDAPAMIESNVTPGLWKQEVQPCRRCQKEGWRLSRPWWRRMFQ